MTPGTTRDFRPPRRMCLIPEPRRPTGRRSAAIRAARARRRVHDPSGIAGHARIGAVMLGPDFDQVLAQAKTGAPAALTTLYRAFNPEISRYLTARVSGEGEDLAADVWVAAAPKIVDFTGDERAFRAWLFTFARRRVIDHLRRQYRRDGPAMRVDDLTEGSAADNPEVVTLNRMSAVEAAQLIARHLSPEQCDVILMRILGDLEVTQVAAAMGQSETWVRVTQHRALRRLARRLGNHVELAP